MEGIKPHFLIDFYKVGHVSQYPKDTVGVYSNWTPRSTHVSGAKYAIHFGMQYFIKKYLQDEWNSKFFGVPKQQLIDEYREVIRQTLGVKEPKTDHLEWLWDQQYLPVEIFSLPEGSAVPLNVPAFVITNTRPEAYWLPNYLETIVSSIIWKPSTSATTAQRYRKIFEKYSRDFGHKDLSFIDWMGHDFSFRGMSGVEDACLSGMGHLLSFSGTDTLPAILTAKNYYGAEYSIGGSVPATEHSVMCAGLADQEFETFDRLLTEVYPSGIVSIVSDTWDLWRVLTDYIPRLKEKILARNPGEMGQPGKIVIRPDSGDPVKILCGDLDKPVEHPAHKGAIRLLAEALGTKDGMINNAGVIYGDSITPDRAEQIMHRTVNELKLSPFNVVLGIGSYTYEYVTRDTYGYAMKATAVRRGDKLYEIYKKPVTDSGSKISHKGIVAVYRTVESTDDHPVYDVKQGATVEQLNNCAFLKVFSEGKLLVDEKFDAIRKRVRG